MYSLLNKYFTETLTDSEKAILFRELNDAPAWKEEFARIQNMMAISGMIYNENDERWAAAKMKELMQITRKRRARRLSVALLKYAAVAVFVSCLWIVVYQNLPKETDDTTYTHIEVPKGQAIHITLADGTETWLSSRTKLKIPRRFNTRERTVELDGEGFFSVSKNEEKPFTVKTKQYNIQVTGTEFNVFAYSESPLFKTDLIKGSVSVYNKDDKNRIVYLAPRETAYLKDGQLVKAHQATHFSQYIKNGIYSFENKSFYEIAGRLEVWYNVKINIKKPEIAYYIFSGKFRQNDSIELIMKAITETGKFKYKFISNTEIDVY
ncbi:MAG: FecR family protein [Tannerellaceae bacterium]|jgi:ferric-dicitrate binding protein FerR (iron transport regulator)|nr:FecR family protein [Tannerellaceae bacterium]